MLQLPAKENFCDDHLNAMKSAFVESYICTDNNDLMANSCSTNKLASKFTMKLFFHLLDLTILNSLNLL